MRGFPFLLVCVSIGCGGKVEFDTQTQDLTPEQMARRRELFDKYELFTRHEKLVGLPAAEYRELLSLANQTRTRSDDAAKVESGFRSDDRNSNGFIKWLGTARALGSQIEHQLFG